MTSGGTRPGTGRIEIITGCMFAGKTAELIERLTAARDAGLRTLALKHSMDDRYDATALTTHDGRSLGASTVSAASQLLKVADDADVIGLDEGHFFMSGLSGACIALRNASKRIIVVTLDTDIWGQEFPDIAALKRAADVVDLRSAPCGKCGAAGRFSQRMTPLVNGQIVGGPEAYEARCPECFEPHDSPAPEYAT